MSEDECVELDAVDSVAQFFTIQHPVMPSAAKPNGARRGQVRVWGGGDTMSLCSQEGVREHATPVVAGLSTWRDALFEVGDALPVPSRRLGGCVAGCALCWM